MLVSVVQRRAAEASLRWGTTKRAERIEAHLENATANPTHGAAPWDDHGAAEAEEEEEEEEEEERKSMRRKEEQEEEEGEQNGQRSLESLFGASWDISWALLGGIWGHLGGLLAVLGGSWAS